MKKLLSILITMSMVLSLVCVPVSATTTFTPATEIFFDDFSAAPAYTISTTKVSSNDSEDTTTTISYDGKLNLLNTGSGDNYVSATIPATAINSASYTGGDKVIIEFDYNNPSSTKGLTMYVNQPQWGYDIKTFGNGVIYVVYDKNEHKVMGYPPVGSSLAATEKASIPVDSTNGLTLGFLSVNMKKSTAPTTFDYVAIYSYEDTFKGELSDVTTTSAILKTNMPINTLSSTFTIGETVATATKVANTYNQYKLTFVDELELGTHTLSASIMPVTSTTAQAANFEFNCSEITQNYYFFDDFSKAPTTYSFNTNHKFNHPYATVIDGKLNIDKNEVTDTSNKNWWGVSIPASAVQIPLDENNKAKYIVEFDYKSTDYYTALQVRMVGGAYARLSRNTGQAEDGVYYLICDANKSSNGTAIGYYPENGVITAGASGVISGISSGSEIGFTIVDSGEAGIAKDSRTTIDYVAVYPYVTEFEYKVSNATEGSALMTTNMPIDTATADVKMGDIDCSVEKLPNSFNKYILRPVTALTVGQQYSVTLSSIKCIDGTTLTADKAVSVTPVAGVTEITGIEIAENEIGNKVAKISGINNIVGYSPEVLLGEYSLEGDFLNQVDYGKVMLPFAGEFSNNANGPFIWTNEEEGASYRAFVFDSLANLRPLK